MRGAAPAAGCAALLLAGCGGSTIRANQTEQTVADLVFSRTGFRPTTVRCPSGIPANVGSSFECRFEGPDGPYVAEVRITAVHGEEATDYIVARRVGG